MDVATVPPAQYFDARRLRCDLSGLVTFCKAAQALKPSLASSSVWHSFMVVVDVTPPVAARPRRHTMDEGTLRNTISRVKLLNTFVKPPPKLRRKRHSAGKQKAVQQKDFESAAMLERRRELKEHPEVAGALTAWWDATDFDRSGTIDREEYVELLKSIYRVKVSADDEEDCQKCAEDDAVEDFEGITFMNQGRFYDGIFELVDLWTETLDPAECAPTPHAESCTPPSLKTLIPRFSHRFKSRHNRYQVPLGSLGAAQE